MRLRHRKWTDEVLLNNQDIGLSLDDLNEKFLASFTDLEIGSGLGSFLLSCATKWTERNFLGVEVSKNAFASAIKRAAPHKEEIKNFRYLNAPIEKVIPLVKDGQFQNIYINFPDPWPKKKHKPRRLTYPNKLKEYFRILKDDGHLFFRTDNKNLFFESVSYFEEFSLFHTTIITPFYSEETEILPSTEYEKKFREKGVEINLIIATKKKDSLYYNGI